MQTSLFPQGLYLPPTVQGVSGGGLYGVIHSPPHVDVGVQVAPVGQGAPLITHDGEGAGLQRV